MKRLIFCLLLLATPALAKDYTVASNASLQAAMDSVHAGDRVFLAAGTYTGSFLSPADSGTVAGGRIRIIGNVANPASVVLTGGVTLRKSYLTLCGIKTTGGIAIDAGQEVAAASHDSVWACLAEGGGLTVLGGSHLLPPVLGQGTNYSTTFNDTTTAAVDNHVRDCTFIRGSLSHGYTVVTRNTEDCSYTRVRVLGAIGYASSNDDRGWYMYGSRRATYTDCRIDVDFVDDYGYTDGVANTVGEQFSLTIRDQAYGNTFVRDTLWVGQTLHGGMRIGYLATGGNLLPVQEEANNWYSCDFRSWTGRKYPPFAVETGRTLKNCGIYFSLFACRTFGALALPHSESLTLRGNTFYSGGTLALAFETNPAGAQTRIRGNVLAARTVPDCTSPENGGVYGASLNGFFGSDSNLFVPAVATQAVSRYCYSVPTWTSLTSNDPASAATACAPTVFRDTAWVTLNLRKTSASSPLVSGAAPGGQYGAYIFDPRPTTVTDLRITSTYVNGFMLAWTEPGVGAPAVPVTSYTIRYSTTPITSGNFDGLPGIVVAPTPGVPGAAQVACRDFLSPNTTYYFALKSNYQWGDVSLLSNVCSGKTKQTGKGTNIVCEGGSNASAPWIDPDAPQGEHPDVACVPNPARGAMRFEVSVPSALAGRPSDLGVYDVAGRKLRTLQSGAAAEGRVGFEWDRRSTSGTGVASGVYYVRLRVGDETVTRTILLK